MLEQLTPMRQRVMGDAATVIRWLRGPIGSATMYAQVPLRGGCRRCTWRRARHDALAGRHLERDPRLGSQKAQDDGQQHERRRAHGTFRPAFLPACRGNGSRYRVCCRLLAMRASVARGGSCQPRWTQRLRSYGGEAVHNIVESADLVPGSRHSVTRCRGQTWAKRSRWASSRSSMCQPADSRSPATLPGDLIIVTSVCAACSTLASGEVAGR